MTSSKLVGEIEVQVTIEIDNHLAEAARAEAAKRDIPLQALIVEVLRNHLESGTANQEFRLKDASVSGRGLQPASAHAARRTLRDMIYRGRGA